MVESTPLHPHCGFKFRPSEQININAIPLSKFHLQKLNSKDIFTVKRNENYLKNYYKFN